MIDFVRNGKRFIAGRGFMSVFNAVTEEKIFSVIDVFKEEDPIAEKCIELNDVLTEMAKEAEKKPKQRKAITKDPF